MALFGTQGGKEWQIREWSNHCVLETPMPLGTRWLSFRLRCVVALHFDIHRGSLTRCCPTQPVMRVTAAKVLLQEVSGTEISLPLPCN